MTFDVFLSYSPVMSEQAEMLKAKLAESGLSAADAGVFTSGADYTAEFLRVLEDCRTFVLIASPDLEKDGDRITAEVEAAFKLKKPIIPYLTGDFEFSASFAFLTENSVPIKAEQDGAVDQLIRTVTALKDQKVTVHRSKKKLMITLIIVAVVVAAAAGALLFALLSNPQPTESGTHGDLTWSYYEGSKTLVISGKGAGADYLFDEEDTIPWMKYAQDIETATVEEGVTRTGIGTFFNLPNLKTVNLPDTLEEMSATMFYSCTSLETITIPDSVTLLCSGAIVNCPVRRLHIPANTTMISGAPCSYCADLEEFTVDGKNPVFIADDGILYDRAMTRLVQYPAKKTETQFTIPDSVLAIDEGSFMMTHSLQSITFSSNMTEIPDFCFGESGLTQLTLPDGITGVGMYAFGYCEQMEQVTLNEGLETIGMGAFIQCPLLKEIVIPDSVSGIEALALCFGEEDGEYGKYHTVIKAREGSDAIRYAKEYDLEYEIIK